MQNPADSNACVKWTANGYRLPTEAQWEFAARNRGVVDGNQYATDDGTLDNTKANYNNAVGATAPVGNYPLSPLGLYDMSGNVREWCWDWSQDPYVDGPPFTDQDSKGPLTGSDRVVRGGSWSNTAAGLRASRRSNYAPNFVYYNLGLRLALPAGQ
jgi:formylglycine-generating enzyme required for sulfatase activity